MTPLSRIRNFSIIAHIDHGKSTLADRLLEHTKTITKREMRAQLLDQMDIERERGITVKLAPVRMHWQGYELNLIDTPGHVDFAYEVSRSLAAVEGALLIVDATQGIQAQTLANLDLAKQEELVIIPIVNKVDLPNADSVKVKAEVASLLSIDPAAVLEASGKTGQGIDQILERIIAAIPPPSGQPDQPLRALIFDSTYDEYQGVVTYIRVVDGQVQPNQKIILRGTRARTTALDVGIFSPGRQAVPALTTGQIGYIVTGLKTVAQAKVGDTVTIEGAQTQALPGYRDIQPMVFAGIFPEQGDNYADLREALERLQLNDASLQFEPEHSPALGPGFRCGFLGLLHLDIVRERLEREYHVSVTMTTPSVAYHVFQRGQSQPIVIRSPLDLPDPASLDRIEEPLLALDVITPSGSIGPVMETLQRYRGEFTTIEYLEADRAVLHFSVPLASILVDFYDTIKSVTAGYATVHYRLDGYQLADVVRLDVLVAGEPIDSLASMVYRDASYSVGRAITERLKKLLPRQMFEIKIQAAIGGKIIASETLPAMRKDVTAKLYGGDVTRKRKLLEKQKKGKQRMRQHGRVDIPQSAYFAVLKR